MQKAGQETRMPACFRGVGCPAEQRSTAQAGGHKLPFTPRAVTMVGARRAVVHSAVSPHEPCSECSGRVPTARGWQGELAGSQPGSGPTQAMPLRGRHRSQLPSPLRWGSAQSPGWQGSAPLPGTLPRSPRTPGRTSARRWPSAGRCCRRGPSRGWGGGRACLRVRQGGKGGEGTGHSSACPGRGARQQHVHSKTKRWARGGHAGRTM